MNRGYLMRLHEDKEQFNSLIETAAATYGCRTFQVEKDYYVLLLFKQLVERRPIEESDVKESIYYEPGSGNSTPYCITWKGDCLWIENIMI